MSCSTLSWSSPTDTRPRGETGSVGERPYRQEDSSLTSGSLYKREDGWFVGSILSSSFTMICFVCGILFLAGNTDTFGSQLLSPF